jgi:futalosine hydrolase
MKILVVAATQMEIAAFIKQNNSCDILICGVGIPSTIYHLTKKLLPQDYDLIIQAGIAGSFKKTFKCGEVVIAKKDAFGDIGVEENKNFKTIFQLGFGNKNQSPFNNGWLVNNSEELSLSHLKKVKAITINKISDSRKQTRQIQKIFNADIESMEGAAFHFVCLQQNIPFLQMRSISNKVGERNKKKWDLKTAIQNLNNELILLVNSNKL